MKSLEAIEERVILGRAFRIYGDYENPLFLAKDVATWIGSSENHIGQMLSKVDDEEKISSPLNYSGQVREMWFLTEDGLYEVLMQSRKPIAKQFKKEVKLILKDIRKHGVFAMKELLENPDVLIVALQELKAERERNKLQTNTIAIQKQQIIEMKPKVNYYDLVLNCKDLVSISVIAKDYGKSAKWLNQYLSHKKVQFKQGGIWLLYQKYAEQGYTSTKTHSINGRDGDVHVKPHTYWSQKGRLFIYELLKADGIYPQIESKVA